MSDNRREPRQKTLLQAQITTAEGFVMSCSVRDLSERGARLSFGNAFWVPEQFKLHILAREWVAQVEVRWRKGNQVGVQFRHLQKARAPQGARVRGAA
jgi:hypothetical protein